MKDGRFEDAWRISDSLRVTHPEAFDPSLPRHVQSIWTGAPLDGKRVLVRCYHGLGDTIQFIRYVRLLRRHARAVLVWVQPKLIPLLESVDGIDALLPLHDGIPDADYDVDVEVMELPYVFRTTADSVPRDVPYLRVPRTATTQLPAGLLSDHRTRPAVGIVWRAGDWASHRSIPFAELAPLLEVAVDWYVLQGEPGLHDCPRGFGQVCGTHDIGEASAAIDALDLLITIDSMPAHLAGALGTPVWTLLSADADWRWMRGRTDSPWYPSMRLYRQQHGDAGWPPVIARAGAALERVRPRVQTATAAR